MFVSVWYAKKMGRRFISNVRKAKKQRHLLTVGGRGGGQGRGLVQAALPGGGGVTSRVREWLGEGAAGHP